MGHWTRLFLRVTGAAALVPGGAHTREISVNAQSAACQVRAVTAAQSSGPYRQSATPSMWIRIPPIGRQLAADGRSRAAAGVGTRFWVRGRHEGRQECSASEPACLARNLEVQRGTRPEVGVVANGRAEGVLLDPVPRCRGALREIALTRAEERLNGKGLRTPLEQAWSRTKESPCTQVWLDPASLLGPGACPGTLLHLRGCRLSKASKPE